MNDQTNNPTSPMNVSTVPCDTLDQLVTNVIDSANLVAVEMHGMREHIAELEALISQQSETIERLTKRTEIVESLSARDLESAVSIHIEHGLTEVEYLLDDYGGTTSIRERCDAIEEIKSVICYL